MKAPAAPAPVAAQPRPAANFFDDLDADVSVDVADLAAPDSQSVDFHAPGVYVPPSPGAPTADWPSGLSTPAQAEDALQRALQGKADPGRPLQALVLKTLESLSELERAVLAGEPQPIDAAPIRKAAVMRLRVAEALASAPPQGSTVDSAALSAIMGEIDGLLAEVAALLGGAPAGLAPALEAIRNSLVREAIDFSEAAQRAAATNPAAAPQPTAPSRRAAQARLIETHSAHELPPEPRRLGAWIALTLVLLLVGGYHVRRYLERPPPADVPTLPGAPEGLRLVEQAGRKTLVARPGKKIDPGQLEKFRAQEELKGNEVREVAPGVFVIHPGK